MSRWVNKLTGLPKNAFWRKYRDTRFVPRIVGPKPKQGYLRTPLTTYARGMISLRKAGNELVGRCPACAGKLIVGRERWRCLGCAGQELTGADLAGMRDFLSRCSK